MNRNKKGRRDPNPDGSSFCGPSAITVLTGRTYQRVEKDLVKEWNTQYRIKTLGMNKVHKIKSLRVDKCTQYLRECGLNPVKLYQGECSLFPSEHKGKEVKTAFQWTKATYGKRGSRWFLFVVGGYYNSHYIVIKGNKKWCTFDPPEGVSLKKWRRWKGSRIRSIYEIRKVMTPEQVRQKLWGNR